MPVLLLPSPASPYQHLVDQVAAGDRAAFAALYDLLAPSVWACARAASAHERGAQRLAVHAFENMWMRAPVLADGSGCPLARLLAAAFDAIRD